MNNVLGCNCPIGYETCNTIDWNLQQGCPPCYKPSDTCDGQCDCPETDGVCDDEKLVA